MTIPTVSYGPFLPPAHTSRDRAQLPLPLPERADRLDRPQRGAVVGPDAPAVQRLGRGTPVLGSRLIVPANSPVARALRLTTAPSELDRRLSGTMPDDPLPHPVAAALRAISDPGLWLPNTYADVAHRLFERHPQIWMTLVGVLPHGSLTLTQRVAVRQFVEGRGPARIAVMAGDAELQALVRSARIERRLLHVVTVAVIAAALFFALM